MASGFPGFRASACKDGSVEGLGLRFKVSGFNLGLGVEGLGFRGLGFRGLGFRGLGV